MRIFKFKDDKIITINNFFKRNSYEIILNSKYFIRIDEHEQLIFFTFFFQISNRVTQNPTRRNENADCDTNNIFTAF